MAMQRIGPFSLFLSLLFLSLGFAPEGTFFAVRKTGQSTGSGPKPLEFT